MAKQEYFELGTLSKPHGIKGTLHVYLDVDDPFEYEGLKSVFVQIGNELVPYFVDDLQVKTNLNLISLEGIDSIDAAKELVGHKLFLPLSFLPKLKDDQFYYHEVVGYQVKDEKYGDLGEVKEIYSTGAQDVIVMNYKFKEVLIPLTDEIIPKVDKKNKIVHSCLPEGLLEVYLDDEN
ncbi:ribosome maturation factor RimM [Aquirufa sp. ROCK-SH2]